MGQESSRLYLNSSAGQNLVGQSLSRCMLTRASFGPFKDRLYKVNLLRARDQACMQAARSRHGKMEKSLLSFATQYPAWEPEAAAKQLLATLSLHHHHPLHASPNFPYTAFAEQLQPAMAPGGSPAGCSAMSHMAVVSSPERSPMTFFLCAKAKFCTPASMAGACSLD